MSDPSAPSGPEPADGLVGEGAFDGAKLAAARLWATNQFPYLASAVFAAQPLPAPGLERIVIDRWWRLHVPAEVVDRHTVAELGGELLHLTSHLLRDHAARADNQGFSDVEELHHWVDAADAEIGDDFPSDLERVAAPVLPADLTCDPGRLAEEYYRQGDVRSEHNDCGSGAHGQSPNWEPPPPSNQSEQGVSQEEQQLIRHRVAADISNAEAAAVSDGLRRWAKRQLQPTVDWRAELAAVIRQAVAAVSGATDYSYRRPSRRASALGQVILPSLQHPVVEVAVICDTSASMTDDDLGAAMIEVEALLRAAGIKNVSLLACDDAVQTLDRVSSIDQIELIGGGGTDMAIGIDAAMALRPRPQLLVVLTDGFTPWPTEPPRARVVVGLLADDAWTADVMQPHDPPPWSRPVRIPPGAGQG